jgi:hypothetical protein
MFSCLEISVVLLLLPAPVRTARKYKKRGRENPGSTNINIPERGNEGETRGGGIHAKIIRYSYVKCAYYNYYCFL